MISATGLVSRLSDDSSDIAQPKFGKASECFTDLIRRWAKHAYEEACSGCLRFFSTSFCADCLNGLGDSCSCKRVRHLYPILCSSECSNPTASNRPTQPLAGFATSTATPGDHHATSSHREAPVGRADTHKRHQRDQMP